MADETRSEVATLRSSLAEAQRERDEARRTAAAWEEIHDERCSESALRRHLDAVHAAIGEAPESDDASLGEHVATIVKERESRAAALEEAAGKWRALTERWAIIDSSFDEDEDGETGPYKRCRECGRITKGEGPAKHLTRCKVGAALTTPTTGDDHAAK